MSLLNIFTPLLSSHRGLCDLNFKRKVAWQQVYDCSLPAKPRLTHTSDLYLVNNYSAAFGKASYPLIKKPQNHVIQYFTTDIANFFMHKEILCNYTVTFF